MVTNRISRRDSFWWGGREVYEPSALGGDRRGGRRVPEDLDHSIFGTSRFGATIIQTIGSSWL